MREELSTAAAYVPLDGFHLAHQLLVENGLAERKGAPDTFDAAGYVALLRRLRDPAEGVVYAPRFERDIEDSIANAIPISPDVPLVITEGNYLLLRSGPWAQVAGLLDEVWYIDLAEDIRLRRLIGRHMEFGRDSAEARDRATGSDQRNAVLIEAGLGLREPGRVGGPRLNFVAAKQAAEGAAGQPERGRGGRWAASASQPGVRGPAGPR